MSDIAIRVISLGKKYRIGVAQERYPTLRDALVGAVKAPFQRLARLGQPPTDDTFWALKDVSFEVRRGEVVGIIGRNGAGKSTLLKVLSRITKPTQGRVEIHGRVGSLLEVGTGFHAELTGRENIYLNGAILGMKKAEIERKFDEIVAFAEIERFLDTPVKRYSSGMYVRLAFGVAAHLEPEILLVDEVLAVGDASFQKKCLGKMSDVAREGRTVMFVSHNMPAVTRLCERGLLLDEGCLILDGSAHEAIERYLRSDAGMLAERRWRGMACAPGDDVARLKSVRVLSRDGEPRSLFDIREPICIEMEYWNLQEGARLAAAFSCFNEQGVHLFVTMDWQEPEWGRKPRPKGLFRTQCVIPGNLLAEGRITVASEVNTREPMYQIHFLERDSVGFDIVDDGGQGTVRSGWGRSIPGVVRPILPWESVFLGDRE